MQYGKMIFHHRKKLGLTQEKLCEGICSVSHLSKIENGTKEAGIETIELLLQKMNVKLEINDIQLDEVIFQLKKLWGAIERADNVLSKQLFEELILKEEVVQYTEIANEYMITIWRYYIYIEDLKTARIICEQLKKRKKEFSQYELTKFLFTFSLFCIKEKNYSDALLQMDEVQEMNPNVETDFQDYCFYRALVYHIINQTTLSMYYCNKAIPIFVQNNNIKRILDAKMLLALQLIKTKLLDRAEALLEEVMDNSSILNDKTIYVSALHNLGFLYYHSKQYKKAINFYQKYLEHITQDSEEYFTVISNIANNMIMLKDYVPAIKLLESHLEKINDRNSAMYIKMKVLYFEAQQDEFNLVEYVRKVALPLWKKIGDSEKLIKYYNIVIQYFQKNGNIEEQNILLQDFNSVLILILEKKGNQL